MRLFIIWIFAFATLSVIINAKVDETFRIVTSPSVVEVALGQSLKLSCTISPKKPHTVIWAKMSPPKTVRRGGRVIKTTRRARILRRGDIFIRPRVSKHDAGQYRCLLYARARRTNKLIREKRFIEVRVVTCDPVNSEPCKVVGGLFPVLGCAVSSWRCDGTDDCGNRYDEINCPKRNALMPMCKGNEIRCYGAAKCIPKAYECDLEDDCRHENVTEDEIYCKTPIIYQESRKVILAEGERLTLNCSANGKPKPDLHWRFNAGRMHRQAVINPHVDEIDIDTSQNNVIRGYTVGNTLIIYRIRKRHSGFYSCEAISRNGRSFLDYEVKVLRRQSKAV